jgi:Leucine-rich repeat (LRR) protein
MASDPAWGPAMKELCVAAGIDKGDLLGQMETLQALDLFQTVSVDDECVARFSRLTDLSVIQARRFQQAGLDFAPMTALKSLILIECELTSVAGLGQCVSLEKVVLDSNQLTSLDGLSSRTMPNLWQVWANDNAISTLASVSGLYGLKDLSLARNRVSLIGHALDALSALHSLNLADNNIGHFREVQHLARVTSLRDLSLSDVHWGGNPVCSLCNYGTYALYSLPQLELLDAVPLNEDSKTAAEATFMKKRMYYNMRIKTLKRNTSNVIRRAGVALRSRVRALRGGTRLIHSGVRDTRREIAEAYAAIAETLRVSGASLSHELLSWRGVAEAAGYKPSVSTAGRLTGPSHTSKQLIAATASLPPPLQSQVASLVLRVQALERLQQRLLWAAAERAVAERSLRWRLSTLKETLVAISQQRTARLVLELSTGGNIRLEDGNPGRDAWYSSCAELIRSRFHSRDFAPLGVTGVRVRGVTRIHNRYLRTRFEQRMASMLATNPSLAAAVSAHEGSGADALRRRPMEYLFYSLPWTSARTSANKSSAAEALHRLIEDGFSSKDASSPSPLPPLPPSYSQTAEQVTYSAESQTSFKQPKLSSQERHEQSSMLHALDQCLGTDDSVRAEELCALLRGESRVPHTGERPALSKGVPFSNSLSAADLPRLAESIASVLEASDSARGGDGWKRSRPADDKAFAKSLDVFCNDELRTGDPSPREVADQPSPVRTLSSRQSEGVRRSQDSVRGHWHPSQALERAGIPEGSNAREVIAKMLASHTGVPLSDARFARADAQHAADALAMEASPTAPEVPTPHTHAPQGPWGAAAALTSPLVREGSVLVCKVFLGNVVSASEAAEAQRAGVEAEASECAARLDAAGKRDESARVRSALEHSSKPAKSQLREQATLPESLPHAVVSFRDGDLRQRQWVLSDPSLALPEYIVDFEYVFEALPGYRGAVEGLGDADAAPQAVMASAFGDDSARSMSEELTALAEISVGGRGQRIGDGDDDGEDEEAAGGGVVVKLSHQEEADLKPLVAPLARFVEQCRAVGSAFAGPGDVQAEMLEGAVVTACSSKPQLRYPSLEALTVYTPSKAVLGEDIREGGVLRKSHFSDPLETLDLHGSAIREFGITSSVAGSALFAGLRRVVLSFCGFDSLEDLAPALKHMVHLEELDLGFNSIDSLAIVTESAPSLVPFSECPRLRKLLVNDNRIATLDDLPALAKACPHLESLSLAYNPVAMMYMDAERPRMFSTQGMWTGALSSVGEMALVGLLPLGPPALEGEGLLTESVVEYGSPWRPQRSGIGGGVSNARYRAVIFASFPHLHELDGALILSTDSVARRAGHSTGNGVGVEVVLRQAKDSLGELVWPELPEASPHEGGVRPPSTAAVQLAGHADRWDSVDSVDLSGCGIGSFDGPGLTKCLNLRRLDASNNLLTSLESLSPAWKLEELILEDNRIASVQAEQLSKLAPSLLRLDLGSNCLTSLKGLAPLTRLVQLSLEDNEVSTLADLVSLVSLMELYLGNNRVKSLKEVRHLRVLPKLIILDLCGNPLCGASKYRLFTVYQLRRLKVLDGLSIASEEHAAAKERYSGRLTVDFLEEKLGATKLDSIGDLDLSSCRIRDIELLPPTRFRALVRINLANNVLTSHGLRGLRALPFLQDLNLHSNKVNSLLPTIQADPEATEASDKERPFERLEVLDLSSNAVSNIEELGVAFLPALRTLKLSRNDISRIKSFRGCGLLRELHLDANRLRAIDEGALNGLTSLRTLHLQENGLKTLGALTALQNLQLLDLSSNRVSDIAQVEGLAALPYLVDLNMSSNPVSRRQLYRPTVLRSLDLLKRLDGREATDEEKAHAASLFEDGSVTPMVMVPALDTAASAMPGRVPMRMASVSFGSMQPSSQHIQPFVAQLSSGPPVSTHRIAASPRVSVTGPSVPPAGTTPLYRAWPGRDASLPPPPRADVPAHAVISAAQSRPQRWLRNPASTTAQRVARSGDVGSSSRPSARSSLPVGGTPIVSGSRRVRTHGLTTAASLSPRVVADASVLRTRGNR